MCMTCGCRDWENDHGDAKNLTYRRLADAAEAGGVTIEEAVEHITSGLRERNGGPRALNSASPAPMSRAS
jgi:hypothetical protein